MRRVAIVLVVVFTVLAGVALPVIGAQAAVSTTSLDGEPTRGQTTTPDGPENETAEEAPGTRLAGSVGVQAAELGGELETRSLDQQLNRSDSNASKARVIARQATRSQARLTALRTERRQLEMARENGSISENEYRVRAAHLSARAVAIERVSNRTTQSASRLPPETLRQNGVNVTSLETLRSGADRLTGPEISAIARSLAGPGATRGTGLDRAANASGGGAGSNSPGQSRGPPEERDSARGDDSSASGNETAATHGRNGESPADGSSNGRSADSSSDGRNADGSSDGRNGEGSASGSSRGEENGGTDNSNANDGRGNSPANASDPGRSGSRVDEN